MIRMLFFVESPLQLLNAYEASHYFNAYDQSLFIVRLCGLYENDKQLSNLVYALRLKNAKIIQVDNKKKPLDFIKLFYYKFFFKIPSNFDKVFIGNYESKFLTLIMNRIQKEKIILLDDGAKTIYLQSKIFSDRFNYNLFTIYDFRSYKNQMIIRNNYNMLKQKIKGLKKDKNLILFLGSKLSETKIISESHYIKLVQKIVYYYSDKKVIYISHREENEEKLLKLSKINNLIIKSFDYPVELYGLYNNFMPHKVASFYSTALYTMMKIYDIKVDSFLFNFKNSKYCKSILDVYRYYEKYFKVIDLNV